MTFLADLFSFVSDKLVWCLLVVLLGIMYVIFLDMKDQKHKMNAMVDCISSLGEDLVQTKLVVLQLVTTRNEDGFHAKTVAPSEVSGGGQTFSKLITVSDDEVDDEDDDNDNDSDEDEDVEDVIDIDDDCIDYEDIDECSDIDDALMLHDDLLQQQQQQQQSADNIKILKFSKTFDDAVCDGSNMLLSVNDPKTGDVTFSDKLLDLKSISIHLEEEKQDSSGVHSAEMFKKMSVSNLRKIVMERGLCEDSSKMKKPELFQLLSIA